MLWTTFWSLSSVREARIKRVGSCEAIASAVDAPMDPGDTPVIRTEEYELRDYLGTINVKSLLASLAVDVCCQMFGNFKAACLLIPFRVRHRASHSCLTIGHTRSRIDWIECERAILYPRYPKMIPPPC
jgi:hypothetical protein